MVEVVLGPEGDDLDVVCMGAGELPDGGAFAPTGRSMRGVEPQEDGSIAGDGGPQGRRVAVVDGEDLDGQDVGAGWVGSGVLAAGVGGRSCLIGGGVVTAGADQEGETGGGGDGSEKHLAL